MHLLLTRKETLCLLQEGSCTVLAPSKSSDFQNLYTEIEAKRHLRTIDWAGNWRLKQLVWEQVAGKCIWSRRKISCSYPALTFFQMLLEDELAQQIRKENGVFQEQAAVPNSALSNGGWKLLSNRWPMLAEAGISLPVSVKCQQHTSAGWAARPSPGSPGCGCALLAGQDSAYTCSVAKDFLNHCC